MLEEEGFFRGESLIDFELEVASLPIVALRKFY